MTKNSNLAITINGIYFTYPDLPVSVTDFDDRFHKAIIYHNGSVLWTPVYSTPGSASFDEKETDTEAGVLFEQTLKFIHPGEDDTSVGLFDAMRRPVIVKITFNKGLPKIFGSESNPAKFERLSKTSAKDSASECLFSCKSNEPAWWISQETGQ